MKQGAKIKIGDIVLISAVLLISVILFLLPFISDNAENAEIVIAETSEVRTVSLSKNTTYELTSRGIKLKICVSNGEIFVESSDCRDGICKNTPPISRAGQSIVCAPAGVVVRITGEEAIVDGVSG